MKRLVEQGWIERFEGSQPHETGWEAWLHSQLAMIILTQFALPQYSGDLARMVIGRPWDIIYILAPSLLYGVLVGLGLGLAAAFRYEKK